jgi:hypothetical protein
VDHSSIRFNVFHHALIKSLKINKLVYPRGAMEIRKNNPRYSELKRNRIREGHMHRYFQTFLAGFRKVVKIQKTYLSIIEEEYIVEFNFEMLALASDKVHISCPRYDYKNNKIDENSFSKIKVSEISLIISYLCSKKRMDIQEELWK